MMTERHYLKDAMPRLYRDTERWLAKNYPDAAEQLPHIYITGRCSCGECSDFHIDSDIPELSRANGSDKLTRPLFYDTDQFFSVALSGSLGLTHGEQTGYYFCGFEMVGGDYPDNYIHRKLNEIGFKNNKRIAKRRRIGFMKRRMKPSSCTRRYMQFKKNRKLLFNPLSETGRTFRKMKKMRRDKRTMMR